MSRKLGNVDMRRPRSCRRGAAWLCRSRQGAMATSTRADVVAITEDMTHKHMGDIGPKFRRARIAGAVQQDASSMNASARRLPG